MPVQKNDVLTIPGESEWKSLFVEWKQSMKERREEYFRIMFTNTRQDEAEKTSILFVSEKLLSNFKTSKIVKTDTGFKLTVDDDFMFGQQKGGKNRFLVYHEKDRDIFQHRFVEGTLIAMSKQATDISGKLGYGDVKMTSNVLSGLLGDKLRSWDKA